ncbi:MAG: DNA translocase FtsK 4TM domain-containing protein [Verrucomicrobiota bacterium]|nr:MAG: DNA translocase FtsK 4TM domain-containing protein [Verrucomicrobiota bacterium]
MQEKFADAQKLLYLARILAIVVAMFAALSLPKRIFFALIFALAATFITLAIFDYTPQQSHYITTHCDANGNLAGTLGSSLAFWSLRFVGLSSYLLPLIPLVLAISCIRPTRCPTWHVFLVSGVVFLSMLLSAWIQHYRPLPISTLRLSAGSGGILGTIVVERFCLPVIGKIGTLLLLLGTLIFLLGLYFALLFQHPLLRKIAELLKNLCSFVIRSIRGLPINKLLKKQKRTEEASSELLPTPLQPINEPEEIPLVPEVPVAIDEPLIPTSEKNFPQKTNLQIFEEKPIDKTGAPLKKRDTNYFFPPIDLLEASPKTSSSTENCGQIMQRLIEVLSQFGIAVKPGEIHRGPVITRYEVTPESGIRVEKIVSLDKNIAMGLAARSVRIMAPVPGKNCVGIELPNQNPASVHLREILESKSWADIQAAIPMVLGRGVTGEPMIYDLAKMPHLLIAGATGAGKTVCINAIIASLLYHASPEDLRFIMVDPKIVEMQNYNQLPHMLVPVVTDPKKVPSALKWLIAEMEWRYQIFAKVGVRNIANYREKFPKLPPTNPDGSENKKLPYIVCIIDELADLMMVALGDIETYIARLAQLARAAGIHLILATQRPSVNVITGIIKANLPSRIAFKVSSKVDSRTILDTGGAETLLGQGDMLFSPPGASGLLRAQGALVSDAEINGIVDFLYQKNGGPKFETSVQEQIENDGVGSDNDWDDEMIPKALEIIRSNDRASTSFLQRKLKIGYNRAARIMDTLREQGLVGSDPEQDSF